MACITDPWPKKSFPNGHPADGMTLEVDCGDGAWMSIGDPRSYTDGGLGWTLTWGNAESIKFTAASVISSYDYLLSDEITMKEAVRRLRLLRQTRREAVALICREPHP